MEVVSISNLVSLESKKITTASDLQFKIAELKKKGAVKSTYKQNS